MWLRPKSNLLWPLYTNCPNTLWSELFTARPLCHLFTLQRTECMSAYLIRKHMWISCLCSSLNLSLQKSLNWFRGTVAWMPDELSPAHNIVCWGSSVWPRSVEEKLCWYENQPDQSNCQGGLYTMMDRWSDQSNCQGGLYTMMDRWSDQSNCQGGLYTMMDRWSDQSNCQGGLYTMMDRWSTVT